jgi:hypothetical protein
MASSKVAASRNGGSPSAKIAANAAVAAMTIAIGTGWVSDT